MADTPSRSIVHARRSWTLSAVVGVIVIMIVVVGLATSLLSLWVGALAVDAVVPGLVPEAESNALVAAAFGAMACGFAGSAAYLWGMFGLRSDIANRGAWNVLTIATIALWVLAAVLAYAMVSSLASSVTQLGVAVAIGAVGAATLTLAASAAARSLRQSGSDDPTDA